MPVLVSRRLALLVGASALTVGGAAVRTPPTLYLLGDSWAAGLYTDPQRALGQVAAARLGWNAWIDAVSGTGYVNGASSGTSYPERAAALAPNQTARIVVVQGGSNDDGTPIAQLAPAVRTTLATLADRFPSAATVLLGPGPDPEPVTPEQLEVDRLLAQIAHERHLPYFSMLHHGWITTENASWVLNATNHHPTQAGQTYLGDRLARELRRRFPTLAFAPRSPKPTAAARRVHASH